MSVYIVVTFTFYYVYLHINVSPVLPRPYTGTISHNIYWYFCDVEHLYINRTSNMSKELSVIQKNSVSLVVNIAVFVRVLSCN